MTNASSKFANTILLTVIVVSTLPVCAQLQRGNPAIETESRIAPPATLECDRNQLTSYNGEVVAYQRNDDSIRVTINTDWDTRETVTLKFTQKNEPAAHFLIDGHGFSETDWGRIETEPGVLVTGTRAFVWVCLDAEMVSVIDWRPGD